MNTASLGLTAEDRAAAVPDLYADFVAVVRRLRRDCPWDREQTHESVKHLLIEEAYEAVDAIDEKDWDELKGELGDLLLHVVFHAEIAETTTGAFTLEDVIRFEMEKLVRRHPHVFGETEVSGTGEVLRNWEQIKQQERAGRGEAGRSALDGVPRQLPALLRAQRIQEKAARVGFDWKDINPVLDKVAEETAELKQAVEAGDQAHVREEMGDLLFTLVNVARFLDLNAEEALRETCAKFQKRFSYIEEAARTQGRHVQDLSLEEMDNLWDKAKTRE